ncbi:MULTISPECIES: copper resistance system multicopper oxidase [Caulobacteraceae]|uniref:copper resistance system multicopper oxidase n=1 Tax=Caulobacteraceae TaxID=76892 RepID=UPI000780CA05|nr:MULTISPECIES: copper resistance system multicopper oxidase [Caulobacteraceae]MBU1346711.1 copper resistance system multicopper oxidase [Alphaproteobacteria bacterium]MDZ4112933.1 copper resistance system multicopper oxidase [Brevundimonas sp.]
MHSLIGTTRRRFVAGSAAVGSALFAAPALGQSRATGSYDLSIAPLGVNFTGRKRTATAINGGIPGPLLRFREGESATLRVDNRLGEMTSIHWHGLLVPPDMDGVPGISFPGIGPGESFTYRFPLRQAGTYWYHAHTLHEQTGVYGPIIIEGDEGDLPKIDRDHVVLLSEWTDEDPLRIYAKLKKLGGYYNFDQPNLGDFFEDARRSGFSGAMSQRAMFYRARMDPTDLSDISGATFTYLMNGTTPSGNWTGVALRGERVRLRFIGAGAATYFDVRLPGLKMTVIAADGQPVAPVLVDEFRIGPGETYDVLVEIPDDRAYTIFAQAMDRSGYARGTLGAPGAAQAEIPALEPRVWLTPADMMGGMAMAAMPGMAGPAVAAARHARTEYGPGVDMRVDTPRTNLDDPGIGLRDNGRRVLTYADLRSRGVATDPRPPGRDIELHLTGNMDRYVWSIDGIRYSESPPVAFKSGERLRLILVNDTMMTHPMHLHGMWMDLEAPDGTFQMRKHTVNVQPAQRVSIGITADAPGRWAFHCHILYHMAAGMFREVVVA